MNHIKKREIMKTINKVVKFAQYQGNIQEIIEFNGKKFKLIAELRNGGSTLEAKIMDSNGVFQFVLGKMDVEFVYTASYVSDNRVKEANMNTGINALKTVIKKIYG